MSDTPIDLVAVFNFERLNSEQYPENERWGEGTIRISTDKEPETQEDFDEIAKAIFKKGGYAQVAVQHVFYDDNGLFEHMNVSTHEDAPAFVIDRSGDMNILNDQPDTIKGEVVDE